MDTLATHVEPPQSQGELQTKRTVRVLSLSGTFPNPSEENLGPFVRQRLQHVAKLLEVQVVAPIGVLDYAARGFRKRGIPLGQQDERLYVHYPRWLYLPFGGYHGSFILAARLLPFLRRLRREYPFDVIDAHFAFPAGIAAAALGTALRCPFTITLRGNETMHAQSSGMRRWMQWAFHRAARIITVSERLRQFAISEGVEASRVRTIPNGVDGNVFYPRPYAETRVKLGIPEGQKAIVSAGGLIERKGHHRVVQALSEMRRQGHNTGLWIIGGPGREGMFEGQIRRAVQEHGLESVVHFTGNVKPAVLAEYMSAADVVCLASSREGWPNVVHEAQACGAPTVATDVGGVQDMIPSDDYGIVVSPADDAMLSAGLSKAIHTRWDRTRIAAWGQARSWERVAAETAEALRAAAEERRV
jgi:glycosyltransferase involved in cell wall biosynthesis